MSDGPGRAWLVGGYNPQSWDSDDGWHFTPRCWPATASYGTLGEPCNHWQKFPNPGVLLRYCLAGETAIEAYWKSVAWPGQGVVIGEPLAASYARRRSP